MSCGLAKATILSNSVHSTTSISINSNSSSSTRTTVDEVGAATRVRAPVEPAMATAGVTQLRQGATLAAVV